MSLEKKPKKPLNWDPVRRGKIYCSPACGFSCKYADYEKAILQAQKLVKRLAASTKPFGWSYRVWENAGWHFEVVDSTKCWKIHYPFASYLVFLGDPETGGGIFNAQGTTPEQAMKNLLRISKHRLEGYETMIEASKIKIREMKRGKKER